MGIEVLGKLVAVRDNPGDCASSSCCLVLCVGSIVVFGVFDVWSLTHAAGGRGVKWSWRYWGSSLL